MARVQLTDGGPLLHSLGWRWRQELLLLLLVLLLRVLLLRALLLLLLVMMVLLMLMLMVVRVQFILGHLHRRETAWLDNNRGGPKGA